MKLFFYAVFICYLSSCGYEKLPKQMKEMDSTAKKTIEGMEQSNENMDRLLDHCYDYVFPHDIVSPLSENEKEDFDVPYVLFNEKTKENETKFFNIKIKDLEIYFHLKTETPYYIVPENIKKLLPIDSVIKFSKEDSLCHTIDTLVENKIDEMNEKMSQYVDENEDLIVSKITDLINKIDEARIDCKQYELDKAAQDYRDSQIRWWEFEKKRDFEQRQKINTMQMELNPHPCEKYKLSKTLTSEEKEKFINLLDQRWEGFRIKWQNYYKSWQDDKKLLFDGAQKSKILVLSLEDDRLMALYELKAVDVANKLKLLDLAKPIFPVNDAVKLREFLAANEGGMKIDPNVNIDYLATPIDRIEILQTIFKRYFYSGNTKEEKETLRAFITDAIFMLYEQQIIIARIET